MPLMHMNVTAVSAVQDRLAIDQKDISDRITTLTAAVHGLEGGAWVGASASQFFQEYDALDTDWKLQMDLVQALAERLKQEIEEWQNAAAKFG